jgi:D-alanyl-D-alanine carboxypeptidase
MSSNRSTKEKFLAILTVVILFLLVGTLFAYIGVLNREITAKLQEKVQLKKLEIEQRNKVVKMTMSPLTPKDITAKAFLTLALTSKNFSKIIGEQGADKILPIASITKLMTALIVVENIDLNTQVTATADYVGGDGSAKVLEIGKTYSTRDLLSNMLISSDNDSAQLLASILGTTNFVGLMNAEAQKLNLRQTHYINVTGLDPLDEKITSGFNVSSARDLASLVIHINRNYPSVFAITRNNSYNICTTDSVCKVILSTNQLLSDPNFKLPIVGSKTGQTLIAGKNLALILEPFDSIFLINIVLGSDDNFADTKTIINHLNLN